MTIARPSNSILNFPEDWGTRTSRTGWLLTGAVIMSLASVVTLALILEDSNFVTIKLSVLAVILFVTLLYLLIAIPLMVIKVKKYNLYLSNFYRLLIKEFETRYGVTLTEYEASILAGKIEDEVYVNVNGVSTDVRLKYSIGGIDIRLFSTNTNEELTYI